MKRICVFCGSSAGVRPEYVNMAESLGRVLAERGLELVYGGGGVGLMGALANAALRQGGKVIGVIPKSLLIKEVAHGSLADLRVVENMHARKALLAELADGFIALPGGFGTYEEFCEILCWASLGYHRKPFGILDHTGFYQSLLQFFDHATAEGFIRPGHRRLILRETDAARLLDQFASYQPPSEVKWVKTT